jgi:Asp/Glu/hydantoin racemase
VAQELVDIPILTCGETAVHFASLMGGTFGVVTLKEQGVINQWREVVYWSGLQSKAITNNPVRGISVSAPDAETALEKDPSIVVRACEKTARELVRDGAEVIIIGCGLYGPMCVDAGFTNIDGVVPVVDPVTASFTLAQDWVIWQRNLKTPYVSRVGKYQRIPDKDAKRIRLHFGVDKMSSS